VIHPPSAKNFSGPRLKGSGKKAKITDSENEYQLLFFFFFPCGVPDVIDKSIPLSDLGVGQSAFVGRISGQADQVHRLEEFGLRGGARIEMFRRGNPCILRMAGNKICFRPDDLLRVLVEPEAPIG